MCTGYICEKKCVLQCVYREQLFIDQYLPLSVFVNMPTDYGDQAVIQFTPYREILALLEEVLCIELQGMLEQCT